MPTRGQEKSRGLSSCVRTRLSERCLSTRPRTWASRAREALLLPSARVTPVLLARASRARHRLTPLLSLARVTAVLLARTAIVTHTNLRVGQGKAIVVDRPRSTTSSRPQPLPTLGRLANRYTTTLDPTLAAMAALVALVVTLDNSPGQ